MSHHESSRDPLESCDVLGVIAQTQPDGTVLHYRPLPPMTLCGGPESPYRVRSFERSASANGSSEASTPKPSSG